ncbi:MAG: sulfite oxidase [Pseudomonadota bacterium]
MADFDDAPQTVRARTFFARNPEAADRAVFGRVAHEDRRGFLKGAGLATMAAMVGAAIPFHRTMPQGLIPVALASEDLLAGKDGLTLLGERPLNAETPPHLLDDPITPTARHFIRNNGLIPEDTSADGWTLTIDGFVEEPLELTIAELQERFEVVTAAAVIECGGNGRAFFDPPARGNQWTYGAVACSEWTGVRLRDILEVTGLKSEAYYTAHFGADPHLTLDPERRALSRGLPIEKALDPTVLVAFAQNGEAIDPRNGAPLRLVVPGWPGSCSQKWLTKITIRDVEHDGQGMTGQSYRMPNRPLAPGEEIDNADMVVMEAMPVKSLITHPATGSEFADRTVEVRGHAWVGDRAIDRVELSMDFGATWMTTFLDPAVNPGAWYNWRRQVTFPMAGYYELWARAVDDHGAAQPFQAPWNPRGYAGNGIHRVGVRVA